MQISLLLPLVAALLAFPAGLRPELARPEAPCPRVETCRTGDPCPREDNPVLCKRYSGPFSFESAEGLVQGSIIMQQWQIANEVTAEIPHQGLLIVHLRAGALVAEIRNEEGGNERQKWREGSVWSVPAKKRLFVHTERESAVLQTVDFIEP